MHTLECVSEISDFCFSLFGFRFYTSESECGQLELYSGALRNMVIFIHGPSILAGCVDKDTFDTRRVTGERFCGPCSRGI